MKVGILLCIALLVGQLTWSQDTLTFQKKGNSEKSYHIVMAGYPVTLITNNKTRHKAVIMSREGSKLTMRAWPGRQQRKEIAEKKSEITRIDSLTPEAKDSLKQLVMYSKVVDVDMSEVKRIRVRNRHRPELAKKFKIFDYVGLGLLGSAALASYLDSDEFRIASYSAVGAYLGVAIIVERKILRMTKWKLVD